MATAGAPPALPAFSAREALARKAADANVLLFALPAGSSLLLPLLRPADSRNAPRDDRWLRALRGAQAVPSRRLEALRDAVARALALPVPPALGARLEAALRPLLGALAAPGGGDLANPSPERLVLGLQLKDRIAALLREWIAEPVEGFVLRRDLVVGARAVLRAEAVQDTDRRVVVAGLRRDDLVATPVGAGYLRAYRQEDGFCTVVYPWGHGLIHLTQVERADVAPRSQLRKRKASEFVQIEQVARPDLSVDEEIQGSKGLDDSGAVEVTGISVEQYRELLESLEDEVRPLLLFRRESEASHPPLHECGSKQTPEAADLGEDQNFVRRVQALAAKTRELQMSKRQRLEDEEDQPEGDDQEDDPGERPAEEEPAAKRSDESMDVGEQQQAGERRMSYTEV